MTYLHQPLIAEGFLAYKRKQRLKYGAAFAACALGSLLSFSIGAAKLNGIDSNGDYRSEGERRAVMMRKLPSAIASFAFTVPLCAFSLRLKRLSEDSHDLREEQRIAHRQWQNALYQPPPPKERQSIQLPPLPPPELNLNQLIKCPFLQLIGGQGSGKTAFARGLGFLRIQYGHTLTVADPHGSRSAWAPWQLIGSGMRYEAISEYLKAFHQQVIKRYQAIDEQDIAPESFPFETLICDEFTGWAENVDGAKDFVKSACSNIRKVSMCVVLISHSDTLTSLGDAKGLKSAIDANAVKLFLESAPQHDGEYRPTGYGTLHIPGQESMRMKVPDMRAYIVNPVQLPISVQSQAFSNGDGAIAPASSNDLPDVCVAFLNWLSENRALAEEGYIRKSLIQQQFKPHRKGMNAELFTTVLRKLDELGYIEFVEESPAQVRLLRLR
ncbi:MAG: hypothetical protein AAF329_22425 [Cyanobacteria bacterium P01_A01_bin.17]